MSPGQIRAWVESHSATLPTTLRELAQFPIPFRKAIIAAVTPEVRMALWCEHLTTVATSDVELSDAQRAFIHASAADIAALIGEPAPHPAIVQWEARMAGLFTRPQASRIFGTLGPQEPPGGLPLPPDAHPGSAA